MSYRPKCVVRAPVATRSGYGEMSRDIVRHLIEYDKYDVEVHSINWGDTPMNALDENEPMDKMILERIRSEQLQSQPDLYVSISVPTEFRPVGRYNIGITAGIETTQASPEWVQAMNQMDVTFVISNHSKRVFETSKYEARDQNQNVIGIVQCEKPIEVLNNCVDTYIYKKINEFELEKSIKNLFNDIPEKFNYLFVGHWLRGDMGQDRKNVGLLINVFCQLFKRKEFTEKPALILKTSGAGYSLLDREQILDKIRRIKESIPLEPGESFPNVYVLHGDLTEKEMASLYSHPKVKVHISFTKGEGFGRPLLEASLSGKPVIAPGWSGHLDFLDPNNAILLGGQLNDVHDSAIWDKVIIKGSKWFDIDPNMGAQAMVELFNNYQSWKNKAGDLAKKNKENFNYKKIQKITWQLLDKYVPEFEAPIRPMKLNLPKLRKPTDSDDSSKMPKIQLPKLKKIEK